MTIFTAWLPAEALKPAHFERAMSSIVNDWGSHWFVHAKPNCRTRLREIGSIDPGRFSWRRWGEQCSVSMDEAGRLAVAEAMLDRVIAANAVQAVDRPLLHDITNRCIDDLIGRLSWLIDHDRSPAIVEGEAPGEPGICWDIGLKRSGAAISLVVHRSALIRWRKALVPPAEKPALAAISRALRSQQVRIEVKAGQGALSLAELEELSRGDVIILDQSVDGSLQLTAAGRATGLAAKLSPNEQALCLDIIEKKKVSK